MLVHPVAGSVGRLQFVRAAGLYLSHRIGDVAQEAALDAQNNHRRVTLILQAEGFLHPRLVGRQFPALLQRQPTDAGVQSQGVALLPQSCTSRSCPAVQHPV